MATGSYMTPSRSQNLRSLRTRGQKIDNNPEATCIVSKPPALIYKTRHEWKGVDRIKVQSLQLEENLLSEISSYTGQNLSSAVTSDHKQISVMS
ncbi:hypothetical protein TNCV_101781 [Trichonephila clavipes]|nr:hypothetical protein TNCV_101781 [Trichonephila clavipes]